MSQIVAHKDVADTRNTKDLSGGHQSFRTYFIKPPKEVRHEEPNAFLAESTPGRILRTHYHEVDQWQVVVKGGGTLGKHKIDMHAVHFTRPYTPYGPIVNGEDGIGFLTLRRRWDAGAQLLPDQQEKLMQVRDREPWQFTEMPDFSGDGDVNLHPFEHIKDERGLGAYALSMKPGIEVDAPDPAEGGGQFIVVLEGSMRHEGRLYDEVSVGYAHPDEKPWHLVAGAEGLKALVLNFPRTRATAPSEAAGTQRLPGQRIWQCVLCSFVYDEAKGMPEDGIAPGTPWEDVPESWSCPDCSASKSEFEMVLVEG